MVPPWDGTYRGRMDHEPTPQRRPGSPPPSWGRTWRIIGIGAAVLAACAGLAVVGYAVLVMVAMSSYGSNK